MDHLTHFVSQYGYWAVAAGCLLEGETVMVLAGWPRDAACSICHW